MRKIISNLKDKLSRTRLYTLKSGIAKIIGVGVVLRLVVMPWLAHPDLLLTYGRSWRIAFSDLSILAVNDTIPHLIQSLWLQFWSIFTGPGFFQPLPEQFNLLANSNPEMMTEFMLSNSAGNLNLFLFKLLYLLVDLAVVWLLWKFISNIDLKIDPRWVIGFYWLNPLLIFATYIFGRYEVLVAFFLLLVIYFWQQSKPLGILAAIGLLIAARFSLIILLPFFFILFPASWRHKITALGAGALVGVTTMAIAPKFLLERIFSVLNNHFTYLTNAQITLLPFPGGESVAIFIFGIAYLFMLYLAWKMAATGLRDWRSLNIVAALTMALMFAFSFYHPHYLAWAVMPLTILMIQTESVRKFIVYIAMISLALPFILLTWSADMLMGLFIPLDIGLGSKDLAGVINNYTNSQYISNFGWTLSSFVWLLFAGVAHQQLKRLGVNFS